jgi:outer membrane receptor protein involved in Fe transport
LRTVEWGLSWTVFSKLEIKPSVFYSRGFDFQYLVATGEFLESASEDPVPVYQRQNVSKVEVAGFELGLFLPITTRLSMNAAYTYNHSKILDYLSTDEVDLTGKELNEVPDNLFYMGINWRNKWVDLYIDYSFIDEQWFDAENTEKIEGYSLLNFRLSKTFFQRLQASLDIQDLLDEQFIDRKGYLSPGRFVMFEIGYRIESKSNTTLNN